MNYNFFISFLFFLFIFFVSFTVNIVLCEALISLFYYEKKLLNYKAFFSLFVHLDAIERNTEVIIEMLDIFVFFFSKDLVG